jgi:hypothetical protein
MPPRTRSTDAPADDAAPEIARAEAMCSHYLRQDDGTFVTYGRGSVLTADQMPDYAWAGYLDDGRLVLTDRPAIRLDPEDGAYMHPISPIHTQEA